MSDGRAEAMGRRARETVLAERDWSRNLTAFEHVLQPRVDVRHMPRTVEARVEHAL